MIDDFIGVEDSILKRENSTHLTVLTHLASNKSYGWIIAGPRHPELQLRNSSLILDNFSLELNAERFVNEGLLFQPFYVIEFLDLTLQNVLELLVKSQGDVVVSLGHGSHSRLAIRIHAREQVLTDLSWICCYKLIFLRFNMTYKLIQIFEFFSEAVFVVEHHGQG